MSDRTSAGETFDLPVQDHPSSADDICEEHVVLAQRLVELRELAEGMPTIPSGELPGRISGVCHLVASRIIPHVRSEYDHRAHLAVRDGRPIPGREQEGEIERLGGRLLEVWTGALNSPVDATHALRGVLFDLHTLLHLHFEVGC